MKKTFQLVNEKIKYPRMIEAVKSEVRKYLKRSRRKDLPKGADTGTSSVSMAMLRLTLSVVT